MDETTLILWEIFSCHLKDKTKAYYLHDIKEYISFCNKPIFNTNEFDVEKYYQKIRMDIAEGNISGGTALRKFKVLSRFVSECITMKEYPENAILKNNLFFPYMAFLKIYDRNKDGKKIAVSDIDKLLSACKEDLLLYAAVTLSYRLGLSSPEICSIKKKDLFQEGNGNWYISILRKSGRYMIYIPSDVRNILDMYENKYRGEPSSDNEPYFLYKNKIALSVRILEMRIQEVAEAAGLEGYSLRDVRNSAAALMFAYGVPEVDIASQLGIQQQSVRRYRAGLTDRDVSQQASGLVHLKVVVPS